VRPRFDRKSLSERNDKLGNLSAISNVRLNVVGGAIVDEHNNGLLDMVVVVVGSGGIAGVASGKTPILNDVSTGMARAGFLINDTNRCRHKSSGISELSTSNSRNCRNLW
jgi:hypothetical protein